ncbi:MAG: hypothetical protein LBK43_00550 [Treponema sp.]|nr:hypothetical protein [Treponema sp.]
MKSKICLILGMAALMVALAACTDLTGPEQDAFSGEPIPPGMGQAHIRLGQLNARTAMPSLDGLYFTLVFTADGKDTVSAELINGLTLTVALESGDWELEVTGYSGHTENNLGSLVVRGTSSVSITAGISSPVVVDLKPDFSSGGTGTLSYSIMFPDTVSLAVLTLYSLDPLGTSKKSDLLENAEVSGGVTTAKTITDLSTGSYQAFIDLYDSTNKQATVWTGVVHIYDGSDTPLAQTFNAANFTRPLVVGASEKTLAGKLDAILGNEEYPSGSYDIILNDTETTSAPKILNLTGDRDITLTIKGNGNTVGLDPEGSNGNLLTLGAESGSNLILILEDITLQGKDNNTASLVQVKDGGTLELKDGSVLTGNTTTSGNGGGVSIAAGGTLTMSGGEISGNTASNGSAHGGGVYVAKDGKFTMSDGVISGNTTPTTGSGGNRGGGGVFVDGGGTFDMSGGEVSGNTSSYDGGGVFVYGSGGKFTMTGGTISDNRATYGGGVYASAGGEFKMSGGVIYGSGAGEDKANTGNGAAFYKNGGGISSYGTTNNTIGTP